MKHLIAPLVGMFLLCAAIAIAGDDTTLKKSDMPEAVLKAFEASNPQAVVTEYGKKTVDGQTRYEIEIKDGELEKDFVCLADGTLLQIEEDMPVESLPQLVVDSVKMAYPDGEIGEADKITKGEIVEFEIIVEVGETDYQLLVSSDGKVLSSREVGDEEDEPGDVDVNDQEDND
jgi:hypothetical protein